MQILSGFVFFFFTNKARNIIAFTSISGLDLPGFGVQNWEKDMHLNDLGLN